jgi:nitroreductase
MTTNATRTAVQEGVRIDRSVAERAVHLASRAPSIHSMKPWRWRLMEDGLVLLAERSRLAVDDPDGRGLVISCGAALVLTELALRAEGFAPHVDRMPEGPTSDVLAVFTAPARVPVDPDDQRLIRAALNRRSDRRPSAIDTVNEYEGERLRNAGTVNGIDLDFPLDEAYIAEMRRSLRDRNVDAAVQDVDGKPLIAVLLTESDTPAAQLATGEAMMRVMLEAERLGIATRPLRHEPGLAAVRTWIQGRRGWVGHPQMLLRIGHPVPDCGD